MAKLIKLVTRIVRPSFFEMVREMNEDYFRCLRNNSGRLNPSYMPRYFFHGTTSKRIPEIEKEGLQPVSHGNSIFLADTYRCGKMHADRKTLEEGGAPVVLYFDRTNLSNLDIRSEDMPFFRSFSEIPPKNLKRVGLVLDYFLNHPVDFR